VLRACEFPQMAQLGHIRMSALGAAFGGESGLVELFSRDPLRTMSPLREQIPSALCGEKRA